MAISLLARVDGEIGAEGVERLLRDAKRAPVARGADHAGIGQSIDHALEGVGWSSMRERAEELGGSFRVTSTGVGTVVAAWLPMTGTRTGAHA